MRRKILLSMTASVLFSLIVTAALVILVSNYENTQNVKQNLKTNNDLIVNILENQETVDLQRFFSENIRGSELRETLIDKEGNVLSDSQVDEETMDNHNTRLEIIDARAYGSGYSIRYSSSTKMDMMYFATSFGDGYVVRSAVPMESVSLMEWSYVRIYIVVMIVSLLITFLFSSRLAKAIVKPIKDLEYTTHRISQGELRERVKVHSGDEIGELGVTVNYMADKLENSFNDTTHKQIELEAVLISMDSGVVAVDKDFRVMLINPYAKKIFGIERDIIGDKLLNTIRDFELEDIIKNKEYQRELTIFWPEKRDLKIKTADIVIGKENMGTVAVIHDITDIKRLENMRSQFVTNVTHELKTPLTSIKGFAETLKYVKDEETRGKFLDIINDEAERLSRLISDILTLSQIEQIRDSKDELIDVASVINQVVMLVKNSAEAKDIKISTRGKEIVGLHGDADLLKQMIINLVDNAVKYSGEGSEVVVSTNMENARAVIS
ncbi:MAG TPA: histidine kinase dimerization/phospho-acceptor domain-containing protein, partial [Clostridiaceae bacterium]|nr:histidine kinase dimerization/phospho-acceptor domain-containing protein [Clostridiaceae bacterium]